MTWLTVVSWFDTIQNNSAEEIAVDILLRLRQVLPVQPLDLKKKLDAHIELYMSQTDALLALSDLEEEAPIILGESGEIQSEVHNFFWRFQYLLPTKRKT